MMSVSAPAPSRNVLSGPLDSTPPALVAILKHHLHQHVDTAANFTGKAAGPPVFYLGVLDATATAAGAVTSNGKGMFTGPLLSGSAAERDRVAAMFPELAPELRGRLDSTGADLVILISRIVCNAKEYVAVMGLSIKDFAISLPAPSETPTK